MITLASAGLIPEDLATKRKAMARGLRKILLARHALFDEVASASPRTASLHLMF